MSFWNSLFGASVGSTRILYCDTCCQRTTHIKISYSEAGSTPYDSKAEKIAGELLDHVPVIGPVLMGQAFECQECKITDIHGGIGKHLVD